MEDVYVKYFVVKYKNLERCIPDGNGCFTGEYFGFFSGAFSLSDFSQKIFWYVGMLLRFNMALLSAKCGHPPFDHNGEDIDSSEVK